MKTILKMIKVVLPVLTFMGMASSCKEECCSWVAYGQSYRYCEDDDTWVAAGYTWEQVEALTKLYGGSCGKE